MIIDLDIPFTDSRVADLRFLPHAPELPILGSIALDDAVEGGRLSLRLLGASHQAVLTTPDGDYAETVACVAGPRGPGMALPPHVSTKVGRWQCDFRCTVASYPPDRFAARCAAMTDIAASNDRALVGRFPGDSNAITYLHTRFDAGTLAWVTVHAYPQAGQMVVTRTTTSRILAPSTLTDADTLPSMMSDDHPRSRS